MSLRRAFWVILALAGLLPALAGWLVLHTESGARWAWQRVVGASGNTLDVQQLQGNLGDGVILRGLEWNGEDAKLATASVRLRLTVQWFPLALSVPVLEVEDMKVTLAPEPDGLRAKKDAPSVTALRLPLPIDLSGAVVSGLRVSAGDNPPFELDTLRLAIRWGRDIEHLRFEAQGLGLRASLAGDVALDAGMEHALHGDVLVEQDGERPIQLRYTLQGSAGESRLQISEPGRGIEVRGSLTDLLSTPSWDLELTTGALDLSAYVPGLRLQQLGARSAGSVRRYALELNSTLAVEPLGDVALSLQGTGDLDGLQARELDWAVPAAQGTATGYLRWAGGPEARLDVELREARIGALPGHAESAETLHGGFSLIWQPPTLRVEDLSAGLPGSDAQLAGSLSWDTAVRHAEARLNWQHLAWPVGQPEPRHYSEGGNLRISGNPESWVFEGDLDFGTRDYPGGQFSLAGRGGRTSAQVRMVRGEALGGRLSGLVDMAWDGVFTWGAVLRLEQVDLEPLFPGWPVRVNAGLDLAHTTQPWSLNATVKDLEGWYAGQRFAGGGTIHLREGEIGFTDLEIREGRSSVRLDGGLEETGGLRFDVETHSPGLLAGLVGGDVTGSGRIAIAGGYPSFEGDLVVTDLRRGPVRIAGAHLLARPQPGAAAGLELSLEADLLEAGGLSVTQPQVRISGPWTDHTVHLRAAGLNTTGALSLDLKGGVAAWPGLWREGWAGTVLAVQWEAGAGAAFILPEPAPLHIGPDRVGTEDACLQASDGGRLCLSGGWRRGQGMEFGARVRGWRLEGLGGLLAPGLAFTHQLDGELGWRQPADGRPGGRAALVLSPGEFGPRDEPEYRVATGPGFFGFEMEGGDLRTGRLDLDFLDRGKLDVDWAVQAVALDGTGQISGRARLQSIELSVLEGIWPQLDQVQGILQADLALGGSTGDPAVSGAVELREAGISLPLLGLSIRDLQMQARLSRNDVLRFAGEFTAGDGRGRLQGTLDFSDFQAPRLDATVQGNMLRVANVPSLRVDADPDLKLGWREGRFLLDGRVAVPSALIRPLGTALSQVSESADVEIVAGQHPNGRPVAGGQPLNLEGRVMIVLGDDVRLKMPAADVALTGSTGLAWSGATLPMAGGQIMVNGDVRAFGPTLVVTDGRVRFPNVPADNPQLNIRAERDVLGNTQIRTAGVQISGTAKRPEVEAYTYPMTTRERAWGLLITGRDFEYGQGVGAFDIGTYIAPRLYVSYGLSLFDDTNIVSVRYDLKQGFGIKATSSQKSNGVDISYTLTRGDTERD